jgi:pimeloyl-ACP methyl ester carboxylesterase
MEVFMGQTMKKLKNIKDELNHGFAELKNGIRIHYVEKGNADGLPVIFLHGYPDSWKSFQPVLKELSLVYHAFAIDLRGFGESSRPDSGYSINDFAEDVIAFLDVVKIKKASVVGHSMGSFIAQKLALLFPERMDKLVLIGSASKVKGNQVISEALKAVMTLQDPIDKNFAVEFQSGTIKDQISQKFFQSLVQESLKAPARVWKDALETLAGYDHSKELVNINHKTLIAWGTHDTLFSKEEQELLLKAIPNASLNIYRDAGHSLNWEQAKIFSRDLEVFLKH